jgi:hypothetical protein
MAVFPGEVPIPGLEPYEYPDKMRGLYRTTEGGQTYELFMWLDNDDEIHLHTEGMRSIKEEIIRICDQRYDCTEDESKTKLGHWVDRIVAFARRFGNRNVPADIREKCNQEEEYIGRSKTDFGPDYGIWIPIEQAHIGIENPTQAETEAFWRTRETRHRERYQEIANQLITRNHPWRATFYF